MLTVEQIIQNYSDYDNVVIRIDDKLQGEKVLSVLVKYGFHWVCTLSNNKIWQPSSFPYCLRIKYHNKTLVWEQETNYQKSPFYIADAEDFLQECEG